MWVALAHYLYKQRWNPSHKFPFRLSKQNRQALEAYGQYWDRLIELCIGCHAYEAGSAYTNASKWVAHIIYEYRFHKASNIRNGVTTKGKVRLAEGLRKTVQALETGENPEDEIFVNSFRLYKEAMHLKDSSEAFRKKYWRPFILAFRAWIRDIESNPAWISYWLEDGKLFEQGGRGNCKKTRSPKPYPSKAFKT